MNFSTFLRERIGNNWVLHPRTKRIVERYGESVVRLSQKQYSEFEREFTSKLSFGSFFHDWYAIAAMTEIRDSCEAGDAHSGFIIAREFLKALKVN